MLRLVEHRAMHPNTSTGVGEICQHAKYTISYEGGRNVAFIKTCRLRTNEPTSVVHGIDCRHIVPCHKVWRRLSLAVLTKHINGHGCRVPRKRAVAWLISSPVCLMNRCKVVARQLSLYRALYLAAFMSHSLLCLSLSFSRSVSS